MEFANRIAYFFENADLIDVKSDLNVVTQESGSRYFGGGNPVTN